MAGMLADMNPDQDMTRIDGIINSMAPWECEHPEQIDRNRRNRIAKGSGTDPADINKLIKDFNAVSVMMKGMAGIGLRDRMRAVKELALEKHDFRLVRLRRFSDSEFRTPRSWWLFWECRRPPSGERPK